MIVLKTRYRSILNLKRSNFFPIQIQRMSEEAGIAHNNSNTRMSGDSSDGNFLSSHKKSKNKK